MHSLHSWFKIRNLFNVSSNRFQSFASRRLWDFLVRQEALQKTIEYHMFYRTLPENANQTGHGPRRGSKAVLGGGSGGVCVHVCVCVVLVFMRVLS